jgi:hypothetical protein
MVCLYVDGPAAGFVSPALPIVNDQGKARAGSPHETMKT